ncbi:uncharacterized protein [Rutidosis leptorrhynchoides]|uniref:uncharacterized protein n=1 Tax=Rutidosis leptorrhynchoides TaxID=125765 RepID=UPI003A9A0663
MDLALGPRSPDPVELPEQSPSLALGPRSPDPIELPKQSQPQPQALGPRSPDPIELPEQSQPQPQPQALGPRLPDPIELPEQSQPQPLALGPKSPDPIELPEQPQPPQQQQQHQQRPSRYESQKKRDWNTFLQYLCDHKPPLSLSTCNGVHVIEFLKYLDRFGQTKVHISTCPYFGYPNQPVSCSCLLKQAWGSLDAVIGRLRAAYEENGGNPESNPFGVRVVKIYLRQVKEYQAKARGVSYRKKKKRIGGGDRTTVVKVAGDGGGGGGGGADSSNVPTTSAV